MERRIQAFVVFFKNAKVGCLAYYTDSIKRTGLVRQQVNILARRSVKLRKLSWFGHVCRHDTLPKILLQRPIDDSRHRGRPRKPWKDSFKKWAGNSAFTHLGLWRKLFDCSLHHFTTSTMCSIDIFDTSNRFAENWNGDFSTLGFGRRMTGWVGDGPIR